MDASLPPSGSAPSGSPASPASVADSSLELEAVRARYNLPAIAAATYKDGKLLELGAAGVRRLGDPTRATKDDAWHLGSCTKAMTALLVGMFVDEGKLAWTDTLPKLLPDANVHPSYANVTIEMLLQHRGGFPEWEGDALYNELVDAAVNGEPVAVTRKRAVYAIASSPAQAAVGTFTYSNTGYIAAGVVLERMAGKPWETLMHERLFVPLGMTRCGFGPAATPPANVDQPWAHYEESGALTPVPPDVYGDNPEAYGPAGRVHCPLEDWARFLNEQLAGRRGESKLASRATFERMHTPPPGGDYAAGWEISNRDWTGGFTLSHSGSNLMNLSTTIVGPAKGLVMVVAINAATDGATAALDDALVPMVTRYAQ